MTIDRTPTPLDEKIFSPDWRAWRDPDIPDWIDPIEELIGRHLNSAAADEIALIADGERVTYRRLAGLIDRHAGALATLGLGPEQRVLLFGTDSLDYIATWLGAIRLGAVPVVVSDLYKQKELLYFITDTAVRMLVIDAEQVPKLIEIAADIPDSLKTIVVRGSAGDLATHCPKQAIVELAAALAKPAAVAPYRRHSNDICYIFYSGGTTGTAKGIIHLAYDLLLIPRRHGTFWEYSADDVVFATSKKYFTHGLWPGVLIPLYWGATVVIERQPPTPAAVLVAMRTHKVTKLITVPTVLKNIIEHLTTTGEPAALPALRMVFSASEKMPPEMFERFHRLTGIELFDSIGSAEITYEWIANRPSEFKRGSLGKPIFGYEVRLVGPDGEDVTEPNVPGEAWIKSRTACFFYWRKYDKSCETFVGAWARTGDNLTFDEDGFFWFSGRNNDLFKVKGLWVSPIDIEAALTSHKAVREAAVVPFDDADGLTKPRAYLVLRDGYALTPELIDELKRAVTPIGSYKIPESFVSLDQLPRTTLLKIDRRALRESSKDQSK